MRPGESITFTKILAIRFSAHATNDAGRTYFYKSKFPGASGAVAIEDYGAQFLKTVDGSHSAIIGLPLFELREALDELGFFD